MTSPRSAAGNGVKRNRSRAAARPRRGITSDEHNLTFRVRAPTRIRTSLAVGLGQRRERERPNMKWRRLTHALPAGRAEQLCREQNVLHVSAQRLFAEAPFRDLATTPTPKMWAGPTRPAGDSNDRSVSPDKAASVEPRQCPD